MVSAWLWIVVMGVCGVAGWLIGALLKLFYSSFERISWHLGVLVGIAAFYLHLHFLYGFLLPLIILTRAGLLGWALVVIEKAILQMLILQYQRSAYQSRIRSNLLGRWVIEVLGCSSSANGKMQFPLDAEIAKDPVETFLRMRDGFNNLCDDDEWKILQKRKEPKDLFHQISQGRERIEESDFCRLLHPQDLHRAYAIFDPAGIGHLGPEEWSHALGELALEETDLERGLETSRLVMHRLDSLMLGLVVVFLVVLLPTVTGLDPSKTLPLGLLSLAPTILAGTLMLGETVKGILAALVFIIVTHPYDVGDRIYLDGGGLRGTFFVRDIGILATTFERWDGIQTVYPNSVLAGKAIGNVRRTGAQSSKVEIALSAAQLTPTRLGSLRKALEAFVAGETGQRHFGHLQSCLFECREGGCQWVMVLQVQHRFNYQNGYLRTVRHNKFMTGLERILCEHGFLSDPAILPIVQIQQQ